MFNLVITQPILRGISINKHLPLEPVTGDSEYEVLSDETESRPFRIFLARNGFKDIKALLRKKAYESWDWFTLGQVAEELSLQSGFEGLLCLEHLQQRWKEFGVVPYKHQLDTALRVIRDMRGRAILADEVGLGKTIEAGMVMKEYLLRGLARKILILTPASLCRQWQAELREKFDINALVTRSEYDWERVDCLIASLDTAKQARHREKILKQDYDLVVIDEAHKLKNVNTKNWQFVNQIRKKYCLMLTATPVQNDLKELFNLITLLKPGQLGTFSQFQRKFMVDRRIPKNSEMLRSLLGEVMIRNRRGDETVQFTRRMVEPIYLTLSGPEQVLYNEVTRFVRNEYFRLLKFRQNVLPLITLQREVCSSAPAAMMTLAKMLEEASTGTFKHQMLSRLLELARGVGVNTKADAVEELVPRIADKVLIFTEYRATAGYLWQRLQKAGIPALIFDGSLSAGRKEWVKTLFRHKAQVLVSTESGGEGLNFQFCHHVINYDLPWNPMRVEQRIGRVHRLGQTQDVHIYNLATTGTIEEKILKLLYEKINMFTMVIGELDTIVGRLEKEKSFEGKILELLVGSANPDELGEKLAAFAEEIESARREIKNEPSWLDCL